MRQPLPHQPETVEELVNALKQMIELAADWSETLHELRRPTHRLSGPSAVASLDIGCRRMEEAFLELQIAVDDVNSSRRGL
ncbi:hypothetical protein [Saccharopolyspora shandongensis]|uniref:hypothetical protein n=1 Tax=Saccharopolyspora shandongensis TaxID=418495 RepID=UPI003403666B